MLVLETGAWLYLYFFSVSEQQDPSEEQSWKQHLQSCLKQN